MSLLELLNDAYAAEKNYQDKNFITLQAARSIVTENRVAEWGKSHPLCLEHGHECPQKIELIRKITSTNVYVFVVLVFAELEFLSKKLIASGSHDMMLFDTKLFEPVCDSAGLNAEQKQGLIKCRNKVGVIFAHAGPQDVPGDAILPFLKRDPLHGRYGSSGVLYRLTVPGHHLRDYDDTVVIAEKHIRLTSDPSQDDWKRLSCEVQTLQKRGNHPNIITLLASYTLDTDESGYHLKVLKLLFPLAEMDLAAWMTKFQPPDNVVWLSKEERQMYIYRSVYELVSGVSYLHREIDGEVTVHYDLKPHNILLVDNRIKIGDFGHSHLRPILEGSATNRAGLGTYEYRPPEYYNEDGSRAQIKHGRAFDVWATGCVLIELATLVVDDWQSKMITEFRDKRKKNPNRDRRTPTSVPDDLSFHNNMSVVKDWISRLKKSDGSQQLNEVLDIAAGMLAPNPKDRPYMWEVQLDLYETLTPYHNNFPELEGDLCVAPEFETEPMLKHRYPMSRYPAPYIEDGTDTPLHRAARTNNRERTIRLWELGWPISLPDGNGYTPLDIMKMSNDNGLRTLEDDVINMLEAAKSGNIGEIKKLFSRGLTPLMVDANGHSALYEAITSFKIEPLSLSGGETRTRALEVIDFLLESKTKEQLMLWNPATVNIPVHTAARVGFVEALDRVLKYYPDCINISARFQRTALCYGAESDHADVIKLLLKNKAQVLHPRCRDYDMLYTPLHAAIRGEAATRGEATTRDKATTHGDIMKLLLEADDSHECMESKNRSGRTPLLEAAVTGSVNCFEVLLQRGASVHAVSPRGNDLLDIIISRGRHDILRLCIGQFSLEELQDHPIDLTFLKRAQKNGRKEVAQLLKSHIHQRRSGGSATGFSGLIPKWIQDLNIHQRRSGESSSGDSGLLPKWVRELDIRQWRSGGSSSGDSGLIPKWVKKLKIRQRRSGGSSSGDSGVIL